jgi:cell pole-organizing protein PopZ
MRQMNQPAKAQEPSMEEILASIRRIIADDDAAKIPPAPEPVAPPPAAAPPLRPGPSLSVTPPPPPLRPAPAARSEPVKEVVREEAPPPPRASARPAPPEDLASDVLDLTEAMVGPGSLAAPGFQTIDGEPDVVFDDREPEPEPAATPLLGVAGLSQRMLMSASTSAAVDSAFNTLAHTVLVQNARTLEDLVREMLQPLLKSWLDDNLPGLVERLVRAEIERVSRGRG